MLQSRVHNYFGSHTCHTSGSRAPRLRISCAAGGNNGWQLPWQRKQQEQSDEYETVYVTEYVTDTGEEEQMGGASAAAAGTAAAANSEQVPEASPDASASAVVGSSLPDHDATPTAVASSSSSQRPKTDSMQQHQRLQVTTAEPQPLTAPSSAFWESSAGGWVVAAAVLLASRQGRLQAEADRLDVRVLQQKQSQNRVQSKELREKRAQYMEQERARKEASAAQRLEEARKKAAAEAEERAARQAEYEVQAAAEAARFRQKREAARKAFEAQQDVLDEELARRTAAERALLEEQAACKAAQEAAARAAEEERLRQLAEEKQQQEEAVARERAELERRSRELEQKLLQESTTCSLQLAGTVSVGPLSASSPSSSGGGSGSNGSAAASPSNQVSVQLSLRGSSPNSTSSSTDKDSSGSSTASSSRAYDFPDAAVEGAAELAHQVGCLMLHALQAEQEGAPWLSVVQPQSGTAVTELSELEQRHWWRLVLLRVEAAGRQAVAQVAPLALGNQLQQSFKVFTLYHALPTESSYSMGQTLEHSIDLVAQQQVTAAINLLTQLVDRQTKAFLATSAPAGSSSTTTSTSGSSFGGTTARLAAGTLLGTGGSSSGVNVTRAAELFGSMIGSTWAGAGRLAVWSYVFAALLEQAGAATAPPSLYNSTLSSSSSSTSSPGGQQQEVQGSIEEDALEEDSENRELVDALGTSADTASSSSSSSSSHGELLRLVTYQLREKCKEAPPDSLAPLAAAVSRTLGSSHPVAKRMRQLAEQNMSAGARQARELRRQQRQVAAATAVLQRAGSPVVGPSGLDPSAQEQRKALVPVPERTWALRNVANSMVRSGGAAQLPGAVKMLREAADLAADHYGAGHPGQLSALLDYIGALLLSDDQQQATLAAIHRALQVVEAVGERYRQQKDLLSLVLLYESAQAELDVPSIVPRDDAPMRRIQRQATDAFSVLETRQANLVMSRRKLEPGAPSTALRVLSKDCTEELAVYSSSKKRVTRLEAWNRGAPLAPLWR